MDNCFKKSKRMPGQSVNSCMCMAMRDLLGKYNKWDLLQRNLGWLYGAAGSAAGVGLPGAGLINPDEREKFTSGKASFGDYIDQLGDIYTELKDNRAIILESFVNEESKFLITLDLGIKKLDKIFKSNPQEISGAEAFMLYDSFGFPLELTDELAKKKMLRLMSKALIMN